MNKNKIVVTGAPGFLGTKLVHALAQQGREVVCMVHPSFKLSDVKPLFPEGTTIKFKNILAPPEEIFPIIQGAHTVFNCVGMQHPRFTREIYSVNTSGPVNLLKVCIAAKVPNLVHISSSTVCGSNPGKDFLTEQSTFKTLTHYARSKRKGDDLLQQHAQQGTRVIILLPAVFYGYPLSPNLATLLTMMLNGKRVPLFGKEGFLRSYVDINTVIEAMIAAEEKGKSGDLFLISDKEPITTLEFYQHLAEGLQVRPRTLRLPVLISRVAEKIALLSGFLNMHLRNCTVLGEFSRTHFVSPETAERVLEIRLSSHPGTGLQQMARQFREEQLRKKP